MTNNGLCLFDKCAASCKHLSLQEEECTLSSWGDSKIYSIVNSASISASIVNSQRMLTKINKSGARAKISHAVKY